MIEKLVEITNVKGWRRIKNLRKNLKSLFRATSHQVFKGRDEKQVLSIIILLEHYKKYVTKFTDQIERRLLKGEVIPAEEKIYSIFEEHTECLPDCAIQAGITKGKLNKKVGLVILYSSLPISISLLLIIK